MTRNIGQALEYATIKLSGQKNEVRLEAELLLSHLLQKNRTFLYAYPEFQLSEEQVTAYDHLLSQRCAGMPIAYIIGSKHFWSLDLKVTKDTLIPRPETEILVELVLELIPNQPNIRLLDLGTGSGAIALAIAKERPHWTIDACDISPKALAVAKENALKNNVPQVTFYQSNWFEHIPLNPYHVIVANPPYIDPDDPHVTQGDLRFEPLNALVSKERGLADLKCIIQQAYNYLLPKGHILLEHGYDQKNQIRSIIKQLGYFYSNCWQDLQGHDRVSGGYK